MIISFQVLQQFLSLKHISPRVIADTLNQLGLETTIVADYLSLNDQLLVAEVTKKEKHPQLDKLWVCVANTGSEELIVICGANNFVLGDKVIFAPIKTKLPNNIVIKKRHFINYQSQGMFCSWAELQINKIDEGIALLPKNAKIGDKPLSYLGYDDCLFKVEIPWQEKEWASPWVVARYLAKLLNIAKLSSNWERYSLNPHVPVGIEIVTQLKYHSVPKLPFFIKTTLEKHSLLLTGNWINNLVQYLNCEMGINLNNLDFAIHKPPERVTQSTLQITINYHQQQFQFQSLPYLLVFYTYQRLLWWIRKMLPQATITNKQNINWPEHKVIVPINHFNRLLGNDLSQQAIVHLFSNSDFTIVQKSSQDWCFTIPPYRLITNRNQVVSEALRFFSCNWLKSQPLFHQTWQWQKNRELMKIQAISNYLLHLGINEQKYSSLVFRNSSPQVSHFPLNHLKLLPIARNWILQTSVVQTLWANSLKKENSFTIDKVFTSSPQTVEENLHLGIILSRDWLSNPLRNQHINADYFFWIQILSNICQILGLNPKHLQYRQVGQNAQQIVVQQTIDSLFLNQGFQELVYQNAVVGQIGLINKTKTKNVFGYLEINLTCLLAFKETKSKPSSSTNSLSTAIYIDLSLQFTPQFNEKIYCALPKHKVIECNHYQHLSQYILSLDKTILKVQLIDRYQNNTLTLRIWKLSPSQSFPNKREYFAKVITGIKHLENVKIV